MTIKPCHTELSQESEVSLKSKNRDFSLSLKMTRKTAQNDNKPCHTATPCHTELSQESEVSQKFKGFKKEIK